MDPHFRQPSISIDESLLVGTAPLPSHLDRLGSGSRALSVENSVAKVPQRRLSDIAIQPPVAGQDSEAVATVIHVSSHNVSMCIHLGVAAGAGSLGHGG